MRRLSIPILTFVLACAILAGAIALRAQRGAAHGPGPLVEFEPRDVIEITTRHGAAGPESLVRRAYPNQNVGARWLVRVGSATAPEWPANEANILGALRLLAKSAATPVSGPSREVALPRTIELTLAAPDSAGAAPAAPRPLRVAFAESSVAGVVAAWVEGGGPASVDAAVADALFAPGPAGWRDRSALPGVGADVSRMVIHWPGGGVTLERAGAGWLLIARDEAREHAAQPGSPVDPSIRTKANPEQVRAVIATLTALVVERFADEMPTPPDRRAPRDEDKPGFVMRVETDRRTLRDGAPAALQTIGRGLLLDASATATPRNALARVSLESEATPMALTLNAEALLALPREWSAYASPTATDVRAADVATIRIVRVGVPERTLTRRLGEWVEEFGAVAPTDAGAPVPSDAGEDAEAILALVCGANASRITTDECADPFFALSATVTLLDIRGETLDTFLVGTARDVTNNSADDSAASAAALEEHALGPNVLRVFGSAPLPKALGGSR